MAERYSLQIASSDFNFEQFETDDPILNGRQIIEFLNARPVDEYLVFKLLPNGGCEEIRLEGTVELESSQDNQFLIFASDKSFRFSIDDLRIEWGDRQITAQSVFRIAKMDANAFDLFLERQSEADIRLTFDEQIDLAQAGVEKFYTKQKHTSEIAILVNGRERKVDVSSPQFQCH